ncbi:MCE family protein [Mycolicibacterium sp. CBMA 226]|uniref:MCE family protein n=1 Tax=Mycolicibacterium sp. CBMA 226 TaxID=2606611 RepID=UPI0012DCEF30|nr:MCE family protein [Mycolicibacterium sp. CBMA 226]MUL78716.1 MCE family protein [Mycolicibacterium sp. CBMA 226]
MSKTKKPPLEERNPLTLGVAALLAIVVAIAIVFGITALDLGQRDYRAEFAQAAELRSGDQVTVAGVPVGSVKSLELAGDRVRVSFTVDSNVRLGADTRASIKMTTLLGSRYMQLSPAGSNSLDHGTIALANTDVPYNLQQTLADATTTFERVDADRIATSLTTLNQGLTGVPEALPEALTNLQALSAIVADRRDQLRTLLTSTDTVTTLIRNQKANLGALISQGNELLSELTTRRAQVQRLLASTTSMVGTVNRIVGDQTGLNDLLNSTRGLAAMIADHDDRFRNLLQVLPVPLRNVANATGSGVSVDATAVNGILVDSWMCAISGRAQQFHLVEYFQDCK